MMRIMIGNIGTGKTLIASKFAKMGEVVVNMDSITAMIAGNEYNLYDINKKPVYRAVEEAAIRTAIENNFNVVIDRTNMDRSTRARYISIAKEYSVDIIGYDFGEGDEKALARRIKHSNGVPSAIWHNVFKSKQKTYEVPLLDEGFVDILPIKHQRYTFFAFDFDGTLVENKFPEIGCLDDNVVQLMQLLYSDLSNIIIIWSCRSSDYELEMRQFLCHNKVPFDFINENPMVDYGGKKIFAHYYCDDRNIDIDSLISAGE